jgi:predicted nucleotidyltransferase
MASEINDAAGIDTVRTIEIVTHEVRKYADDVRKAFPVVKAFLFGSWAKGTATKRSDVDVCFFLESWGGRRRIDVLTDISLLTRDYFWLGIEPHAIKASFLDDDHPFVREILETGIEI